MVKKYSLIGFLVIIGLLLILAIALTFYQPLINGRIGFFNFLFPHSQTASDTHPAPGQVVESSSPAYQSIPVTGSTASSVMVVKDERNRSVSMSGDMPGPGR
jgi:hypothetical protein